MAWAAFAFWLFSFSFSRHFFEHDLASRLPPFLTALFAALVIPYSAVRQVLRARSAEVTRIQAGFTHAIVSGVSFVPLLLTAAILPRMRGPFHLSGDDAMGVGIDILLLFAFALLSILFVGIALAMIRPASRK